jgi:hypothetical protein
MEGLASWTGAHRGQIAGCLKSASEGFVANRYLLIAGEDGAAALGLYMAVKCGVEFL